MHFQNKLRSVNCSYFKTILCRSAWNFHCVFLSTVLSEKNLPIASGHPSRLVLLVPLVPVALVASCGSAGPLHISRHLRKASTDRQNATCTTRQQHNREAKRKKEPGSKNDTNKNCRSRTAVTTAR